jgi:hypothetical protein
MKKMKKSALILIGIIIGLLAMLVTFSTPNVG